jgi:molybdopterin-biosynthesis enzyme MoeA-like protein
VAAAFANLGLGDIVGRDVDSVIAAIADAICPVGADREEVAAREATAEALEVVFSDVILAGGAPSTIDAMTAEAVSKAVEAMVASYIYNRWLGDLGVKIEEKAISPTQAVQTESRMREFIRDAVKLDLQQKDPLKIDWRGAEGKDLMGKIYSDAFSVIGGER